MSSALILWLASLALVLRSSAQQADKTALWPMFGGNAQHTSQSLQTSPASEPYVTWALSFGGSFPAPSPAVSSSGVVFAASQSGLTALEGATGVVLWTASAAVPGTGSTPALSASCLVIFGSPTGLSAVSCENGSVLWHWQSELPFSPPTIAGGVVLAGCDDYKLYALNLSTGHLLWDFTTSSYVRTSPAVSVDGTTVFVSSSDWRVSSGAFVCLRCVDRLPLITHPLRSTRSTWRTARCCGLARSGLSPLAPPLLSPSRAPSSSVRSMATSTLWTPGLDNPAGHTSLMAQGSPRALQSPRTEPSLRFRLGE